ncbi:MAG TPA: peptidylprolyl isomerase, partial [Povalibacter sp.]
MSATFSPSDTGIPASVDRKRTLPGWLREPLLHFVVLGAVLFGVDQLLVSRTDDPRLIVVDAEVDNQAIELFKSSRDRAPNAEELYALRRVWLDNEVLYREGLAMELDKGDKAIRERVIFKALSVVDASTKLPAHDDVVLREYFERNRSKYDDPARYSFQEAVLAGDKSESALRAFASALNAGNPGDAQAGLRVFRDRPRQNLEQSYGAEFISELEALPPGEWRTVHTRDGMRVMQLQSVAPPKLADFDSLRGVILQDWTDATLAEQRSAAVRALSRKYT